MKQIIPPKRKDYLRFERGWFNRSSLIHYETQNYNPLTIITLLNLVLIIAGFFKPQLLAIPIATIILLVFTYIKLKHMAKMLEIRRITPKKGKEGEEILVPYILYNYSLFSLERIYIIEKFNGTNFKKLNININKKIKSKRKKRLKIKYPLNEGFGEKTFNEFTFILSDSLGLFTFKVIFDQKDKIIVFPDIQNMLLHKVLNNDDSYLSGDYEVFKKGVSPNFYGIKPYQYGDPVKNINWKISRKKNELVVNEFENAVNLNVHYILNFSEDAHLGIGVNSTWEYCRDIALALLKNEVEKNHFFDVHSNQFKTELASGKDHFELIEIQMCYLKPLKSQEDLIKESLIRIPRGHALVYISPFVYCSSLLRDLRHLKENFDHFSAVHIYLVDPFDTSYKLVMDEYKTDILRMKDEAYKNIALEIIQLKSLGINISMSTVKRPHQLIRQTKLWDLKQEVGSNAN